MARKTTSFLTNAICLPGSSTVPGWIVSPMPSTVQPEMSTDSVADGLVSSMNSALAPPAGSYWISLITTFGAAACEAGTGLPGPVLFAITA